MPLHARSHWIFDLDGTLTIPVHDFLAARDALGIPHDCDILGEIERWPEPRAQHARAWLDRWERDLAEHAAVQPDALALVHALVARGARCGILTRNTVPVARLSLARIGLADAFPDAWILGRESAAPKPSPAGILHLLGAWGCPPSDAVMVGDYVHDVRAGRAAGVATVLVNRDGESGWDDEADLVVSDLHALADRI